MSINISGIEPVGGEAEHNVANDQLSSTLLPGGSSVASPAKMSPPSGYTGDTYTVNRGNDTYTVNRGNDTYTVKKGNDTYLVESGGGQATEYAVPTAGYSTTNEDMTGPVQEGPRLFASRKFQLGPMQTVDRFQGRPGASRGKPKRSPVNINFSQQNWGMPQSRCTNKLGEIKEYPKSEPPADAFMEQRIPPYVDGQGCSSEHKRHMLTTIPYTDDIHIGIDNTKTILRQMDSENDPLPFPNRLRGVVPEPAPQTSPSERLRQLTMSMKQKSLAYKASRQESMNSQIRRHFEASIPFVPDPNFPQASGLGNIDVTRNYVEPEMSYNGGGSDGMAIEAFPAQSVRADGAVGLVGAQAQRTRATPIGNSIPYRADNEPPPVYTRPPPNAPYLFSDPISALNIEVISDQYRRPTKLALMKPAMGGTGMLAGTGSPTENYSVVPGGGMSGEMISSRNPRSVNWQQAYTQARRPMSLDRYHVSSTFRNTIPCEYTPPSIGQRTPLDHVHVTQNAMDSYKQHLYPSANTSTHYLWKNIENHSATSDARYWQH